jgi:MFS family permease
MTESKRPLLTNRNFMWLWGGQSISVIGSQMSALALPVLAVSVLGATEWQMGFLNAADTSAFLAVGLLAGAWVDRWIKRRVMLIADLIRMLALLSLPALFFLGQLQIWHLFVVGAILSVATVFFDVSYQSFVPLLVEKDLIGTANSRLETSSQISVVAGPGIAGILLQIIKPAWLILADALTFGFSALTISRMRDNEQAKPKEVRRPLRTEIAEGLRFVWNQPMIRAISFTTATSNLFSSLVNTLVPLLILRDLHFTTAEYGLVMTVAPLGGLVGAAATSKLIKWIGEGPLVAISAVVMGLVGLLIPIAATQQKPASLVLFTIAWFFTSLTVLTYNITQVSARQRLCPPELLGRMNASIRFFVWGVMPIGALLAGWLGTVLGIVSTIWLGSILGVFCAGFVVFSPLSRMRRMPDAPAGD